MICCLFLDNHIIKILSLRTSESLSEDQHEIIETAAEVLYGLIHARYILTAAGMSRMVCILCFIVLFYSEFNLFVVFTPA